ncbi:MAG: hypothetical protein H0Z38_06605 [Firmicutes bacterium]|nr:hypothetical protein [Bacillota bacterium]
MAELSKPSPELAAKILKEVEYDNRLVGLMMTPMSGSFERSLWSFEEAVNFLHIDKDLHSNQASIRYIDLNLLQRWIAEVFSDTELAAAIRNEIAKYKTFGERVNPVRELMLERLNQCKTVAQA